MQLAFTRADQKVWLTKSGAFGEKRHTNQCKVTIQVKKKRKKNVFCTVF